MNNQIQLVLKSSTAEMPLNDHELGIYLTPELDGLVGLPEIRTTSGVNAGYDGGWTSAQNYDARSITIRGVIANTDVATVERLRKQLVSLAGQGKSEELTLDLVTEAGNAYTLQVRTIALEMSMQSVLEKQEFMLQLRADDPLIYDAGESAHEATLQVAKATGGFTIDFELPLAITGGSEESVVNNDGLEEVPTIVKMYGALHNPKIINQTNNEQMQIMTDLGYAEGAWHTPSEASEGANISLANTPDSAPFSDIKLKGDTAQNGTPTPDAPVAVQTVTGENVVKITGKNLFNKNAITSGKYISSTGTLVDAASFAYSDYIPVIGGENYSYSGSTQTVASDPPKGAWYDKDKNWISKQDYVQSGTITAPANAAYYRTSIRITASSTSQPYADTYQLELGSTATAYEPYQGQSYEVNLGKNLFDKDNAGGLFEGYISGGKAWAASGYWSYYIPCKPNTTYTASRTIIGNGGRFAIATSQTVPGNNVGVAQLAQDNTATTLTITTNSSAKYIIVWFANVNDAGSESLADWAAVQQLEKGSQASSYAAYFIPIELCKIGDYQDYIYKSDGKWYVHKATGKAELSTVDWTSQGWGYQAGTGISNIVVPANSNTIAIGIGTCFIPITMNNAYGLTGSYDSGMSISTSGKLMARATSITDLTTFNAAMAGQSFYYALATPTDTEITNEALMEQLDNLLNLSRTYQGRTNLSSTYASGNMPAILNVNYYTEKEPDTRDELIIDSRLHTVTLNGLDIYHLIGEGSEFLMLEPGENRLSLQSDITGDNGYAVVSYKQGYLSI